MQEVLQSAIHENVAFVPGDAFYAHPETESSQHMRLNFSSATPEQIREGIMRLSLAVKSQLLMNYA
jgi:2-aminoadipate transaminase